MRLSDGVPAPTGAAAPGRAGRYGAQVVTTCRNNPTTD